MKQELQEKSTASTKSIPCMNEEDGIALQPQTQSIVTNNDNGEASFNLSMQ